MATTKSLQEYETAGIVLRAGRQELVRTGGQRTWLSAVLLRFKKKEYRIRYYLSSEKLKAVD